MSGPAESIPLRDVSILLTDLPDDEPIGITETINPNVTGIVIGHGVNPFSATPLTAKGETIIFDGANYVDSSATDTLLLGVDTPFADGGVTLSTVGGGQVYVEGAGGSVDMITTSDAAKVILNDGTRGRIWLECLAGFPDVEIKDASGASRFSLQDGDLTIKDSAEVAKAKVVSATGVSTFGTDTPYGPGITISPPDSKVQIRGATGELVVDNDASKSLSVAVAADAGQGAFQLQDMNFRVADSTLTNILDVDQGTRIVRASDRLVARIAETEEAFVLDGATVTVADGANDNVATATPVVRFSGPTANWSITGMSNGLGAPAGSIVVLVNISSYAMTVVHNASSSATNRFYLHGGANVVVPNGHAITVYYRATGVGNRWTDIPEAVTGSGSDTYVTSWDGTDILTGDANFKYDGSTVMVGSPTKIALSAGDGTATFGTDTPYADGTTIKSDEVVTTQGYVSVDLGSGANVGSVVLTAETAAGGATVGKIHLQAARQGVTDSYIAINNDDATVSTIINPDTTSTISRGMDVIFKDTADAQTAVITAATGYGNFAGLTTVPIDLGIAAVFQTNLPVAAGPLTINTSSGFVTLVDSGLAAGFNAIQITTPQDHAHSWVVEVLNATGFTMTVKHQDGGAGANDKFICPTLADVTVATGGYAKFAYGSWPTIGTPGWLLLDWRT